MANCATILGVFLYARDLPHITSKVYLSWPCGNFGEDSLYKMLLDVGHAWAIIMDTISAPDNHAWYGAKVTVPHIKGHSSQSVRTPCSAHGHVVLSATVHTLVCAIVYPK